MNLRITELKTYLEKYLKANKNILLTGLHGIGKTHIMKEVLDENKIKYYYCSGATLDPWVDFIGIPKEVEKGGGKVLEFLRPETLSQDIEVIIIDEYNRAPKAVRNACMELIQFKTLNGVKFGELRCIWAAINPDDDENINYDVERLDHTQKDRFEIHLNLPYELNSEYFEAKYSEYIDLPRLNNWWDNLRTEEKLLVSPRRVEMAILQAIADLPTSHIFPPSVSTLGFDACLKTSNQFNAFHEALKEEDEEKIAQEINDPSKAFHNGKTLEHFMNDEMKDEKDEDVSKALGLVASKLDPEIVSTNYERYVPYIASLLTINSKILSPEAEQEYCRGMNSLICATLFNLDLKEQLKNKTLNDPIIQVLKDPQNVTHTIERRIFGEKFVGTKMFADEHGRIDPVRNGEPRHHLLLRTHRIAQQLLKAKQISVVVSSLTEYGEIVDVLLSAKDPKIDLDKNLSAHIAILKWSLKRFSDVITVMKSNYSKAPLSSTFPFRFVQEINNNFQNIYALHKEIHENEDSNTSGGTLSL